MCFSVESWSRELLAQHGKVVTITNSAYSASNKKVGVKLGWGHELSSMVKSNQLELFGTLRRMPREPREPRKWWQEVLLGAPVHTRRGPG